MDKSLTLRSNLSSDLWLLSSSSKDAADVIVVVAAAAHARNTTALVELKAFQ